MAFTQSPAVASFKLESTLIGGVILFHYLWCCRGSPRNEATSTEDGMDLTSTVIISSQSSGKLTSGVVSTLDSPPFSFILFIKSLFAAFLSGQKISPSPLYYSVTIHDMVVVPLFFGLGPIQASSEYASRPNKTTNVN